MGAYLIRSWREIIRYKGRNLVALIGITVMVGMLSALLSFLVQLSVMFTQSDSDFMRKLQIIEVFGQDFNSRMINEMASIEGVEHVLPLSNPTQYPWSNFTVGDYAVLPIYVLFYDPQFADFFSDPNVMKQTLQERPDAIVSADFGKNVLSAEEYRRAFGIERPTSLESLDTPVSKLVRQYQVLKLSSENRNAGLEFVGEQLDISIEHKFFAEEQKNVLPRSTAKITGQLKPDFLGLSGNQILLPSTSVRYFVDAKERNTYPIVYVKAKSNEDVAKVVNQLRTKGYVVPDDMQLTKKNTNSSSEFIRKIAIVMIVILLVSILSFANSIHSSIEERRRDIGLRKALGAKTGQILAGFILEAVILVSIALLIGFALVSFGFYGLRMMVRSGAIDPAYYEGYQLDRSAMEFILQVPPAVYVAVSAGVLMLGILASLIPARTLVRKGYMSLMKRG